MVVVIINRGDNKLNEEFYDALNENRQLQLTHCKLNDLYTIRFVVGSPQTGIFSIIKNRSKAY